MSKILKRIPLHILMIMVSFGAIFPFYYMIVTAFKSETEFYDNTFGIPIHFTLENLIKIVIEKQFYKYFFNSLILTASSVIIAILVSLFAAFSYAKLNFRGKDIFFNTTIALTSLPAIVVVIPIYGILAKINLLNTFSGVSFIYAGFMIPFTVFVLTSFFKTIENEIMDAAKIDGCSNLVIIFKIIIPMSKPPLIYLIIANGLWVWNDLLIALLLLQDDNKRTLVVKLGMFMGKYVNYPTLIMAGSLIVALPMIIVYLFGQRYFVKGLTAGAIK